MVIIERFKERDPRTEDHIAVRVSLEIIRHVSAQLYTNPRKAIEELVCNSYDAGASECHIAIPTSRAEPLAIMDNGVSMDLAGFRHMWKVATSPKGEVDEEQRIDNRRLQIGKFGVGKLAAYALGDRLTHVACRSGTVRIISVNVHDLRSTADGEDQEFEVYRLPLSQAKEVLDPLLGPIPRPWDRDWKTWTLAIVEDIQPDAIGKALMPGHLKRMIRTSLPLSPKFKIFLDGDEIGTRVLSDDEKLVERGFADEDMREKIETTLRHYWAQRLQEEDPANVPSSKYKVEVGTMPDPADVDQEIEALIVPELGPIAGTALIARESLTPPKVHGRGYRDNGFQVFAHNRLINPEDELFGVTQRSHAYWRRFRARVEMPWMDKVLLVQRNAVEEENTITEIAREILRATFNHLRNLAGDIEEEEKYEPKSMGQRLSSLIPTLAPLGVRGLAGEAFRPQLVIEYDIAFESLGEATGTAIYDKEKGRLLVNVDHPLIATVDETLPASASKAMRRVLGELYAGSRLVEGYLMGKGVDEGTVDDVSEIHETSALAAANYIRDPVAAHVQEIEEASRIGGTVFEKAVVNAFTSMRITARHVGGPEAVDGILGIPRPAQEALMIAVEAKGS